MEEIRRNKDETDKQHDKEEKQREVTRRKPYGQYKEIIESEFLDTMLQNSQVVCHFYSEDFERCKIADKHLYKLAQDHGETLFVKINANKSPFFTTKLDIKVNKFYNK